MSTRRRIETRIETGWNGAACRHARTVNSVARRSSSARIVARFAAALGWCASRAPSVVIPASLNSSWITAVLCRDHSVSAGTVFSPNTAGLTTSTALMRRAESNGRPLTSDIGRMLSHAPQLAPQTLPRSLVAIPAACSSQLSAETHTLFSCQPSGLVQARPVNVVCTVRAVYVSSKPDRTYPHRLTACRTVSDSTEPLARP